MSGVRAHGEYLLSLTFPIHIRHGVVPVKKNQKKVKKHLTTGIYSFILCNIRKEDVALDSTLRHKGKACRPFRDILFLINFR